MPLPRWYDQLQARLARPRPAILSRPSARAGARAIPRPLRPQSTLPRSRADFETGLAHLRSRNGDLFLRSLALQAALFAIGEGLPDPIRRILVILCQEKRSSMLMGSCPLPLQAQRPGSRPRSAPPLRRLEGCHGCGELRRLFESTIDRFVERQRLGLRLQARNPREHRELSAAATACRSK